MINTRDGSFVNQSKEGEYVLLINITNSKNCDDILKFISEELNVKGNFYDILETYISYKNIHFKTYEKKI